MINKQTLTSQLVAEYVMARTVLMQETMDTYLYTQEFNKE